MSDFWQETIAFAKTFRKELHQYPELSWQEQRTAERIRTILSDLNIPWRQCAKTGTVAYLNTSASSSPNIALRADIDALPIVERTALDHASTINGCMHACGHDGHAATLLATAMWLKRFESRLSGPVTLLFQPAEEGGHGAREMILDGALEGVSKIFGWHNWPAIPFAQMTCPDGLVMAGNGVFEIEVIGKGGHASQPDQCRDPVLAASALTIALQQIVAQRLPAHSPAVIAVTCLEAKGEPTIIPDRAILRGSIRIPSEDIRELINRAIAEVASGVAQSYRVECQAKFTKRYQATINHSCEASEFRHHWLQHEGETGLSDTWTQSAMASEDFSYYLNEIPGAYALIGADDGNEHHHPCHSALYDFNDRLIEKVVRVFSSLVGAPVPGNF